MPASTGPTTRARLNWIEFSATALGRSSRSTSVGTSAWYAGPPKDCARPTTKERVRMIQTWIASGQDQSRQQERARHLHELRTQQDAPSIEPVGQDAAEEREQQKRRIAEKRVESQQKRRPRDREDQPVLRDLLHPGADAGREGTGPHQAKVAVRKRLERALQSVSCFDQATRPNAGAVRYIRREIRRARAGRRAARTSARNQADSETGGARRPDASGRRRDFS